MNDQRMTDAAVLRELPRLLGEKNRTAIIACARRGLGEARSKAGIRAMAKELGADPRTVLAAFGFLPSARNPRVYLDALTDADGEIALLPSGATVAAAFALSRAVHPAGCQFVTE